MFDGMDPGAEGILHSARPMGVGCHVASMGHGDFHGRRQFLDGHLGLIGGRARRQYPPEAISLMTSAPAAS